MADLAASIRAAIQALFDADGEGWQVGQWVAIVGIERVRDDNIESTSWYVHPPDQAEWMTDGLLESVITMRHTAELTD